MIKRSNIQETCIYLQYIVTFINFYQQYFSFAVGYFVCKLCDLCNCLLLLAHPYQLVQFCISWYVLLSTFAIYNIYDKNTWYMIKYSHALRINWLDQETPQICLRPPAAGRWFALVSQKNKTKCINIYRLLLVNTE